MNILYSNLTTLSKVGLREKMFVLMDKIKFCVFTYFFVVFYEKSCSKIADQSDSTKFNCKTNESSAQKKKKKCLFINVYLDLVWFLVTAFFLYAKVDKLQHFTKHLSVTVFTLQIGIEIFRLYLGYCGNLSSRVPDLAGFLMLTVLMQLPLVSFFLFNPYLLNTPTEVTLHALLWLMSLAEIQLGYFSLKQASALAKSVYLKHPN